MKAIILGCIVAVAVLIFTSCNDKPEVQRDYDFALSSWHLQRSIKTGEVVEIRFTLDRVGDYHKAEYYIGYVQLDGKGEVFDTEKRLLVNRELHELRAIPDLNAVNPQRQVFTLFYRSMSTKKSELKFVIVDNFNQERKLLISFDNDSSTE